MDIIHQISRLYRYGDTQHRRIFWMVFRSAFPSRRSLNVFTLLLALAAILRWVALGQVPLVPEEAYYWLYSQHPDLSYFDHPPMVAGMIGLGTALFGNTEFGVRIVGHLLMIATSILMFRLGREWFNGAAGLLAALMLHVLPVYFGAGFIATMDPALLCFWMLCLNGITIVLRQNRTWGWYLAGIGLGGTLLSKYSGIFLIPGAVLALTVHKPWRRYLRSPHPYLACLTALVMFTPVILWNARHDWASFRFQVFDRYAPEPMHVYTILMFIGFQCVVATPAILWSWGMVMNKRIHHPHLHLRPAWIFALAFSLPMILTIALKSLRYETQINWTLPGYLSLLPAVSHWYIARAHSTAGPLIRKYRLKPLTWSLMICLILNITMLVFLMGLQPRVHWISAFGPWEELAEIVEDHENRVAEANGGNALVIAEGKYRLASVLAFYRCPHAAHGNPAETTTSHWILGGTGLSFPYWLDAQKWCGHSCLFIDTDRGSLLQKMNPHFESVEPIEDPRLEILGRGYYLAVGNTYRISEQE